MTDTTPRLNTWNGNPDEETADYHRRQWAVPYRSTVHFAKFIDDKIRDSKKVVDAGCGLGAPTWYLAQKYPHCRFWGLDVSERLIWEASGRAGLPTNLSYEADTLTSLRIRFDIDGVTLIQVLSWLPGYELALHQIATRLRPKWLAFSTLMYEHNIDCRIVVTEHERPRQSYYNVYGLPRLKSFMQSEGYELTKFEEFRIDQDLPRPHDPNIMGSYTLNVGDTRLTCSGPLLLPWHFVMFERKAHE